MNLSNEEENKLIAVMKKRGIINQETIDEFREGLIIAKKMMGDIPTYIGKEIENQLKISKEFKRIMFENFGGDWDDTS